MCEHMCMIFFFPCKSFIGYMVTAIEAAQEEGGTQAKSVNLGATLEQLRGCWDFKGSRACLREAIQRDIHQAQAGCPPPPPV